MSNVERARAWVEVDLDALRANFERVRDHAAGAALVPMVKADAYGLGAARVVRALEPLAPAAYGVATAGEGAELRALGVERPVIVFGPLPAGDVPGAAASGLTATISSLGGLERWAEAAAALREPLEFHVEVDTGMGRCGFDWRDAEPWGRAVARLTSDALRWTGVFTHFHSGDAESEAATAAQWERFQAALVKLPVPREALMVHAANSAAALRWPAYAADAVRPGIFLYGGDPAPAAGLGRPRPVAHLRARLVLVREVAAGSTVGYGATHEAVGAERWGTLSVGYGDGLPRASGNRGTAIVRGRVVPIIGRVSMDLTVVDLTAVPDAGVGDIVTLIGTADGEEITVDEVAAHAGTIGYEVLTGLSPRLPRIEVRGVDG